MADPTSLGVIDEFVVTFTRYIDSGFGLLNGEVHYLTAILIGIDITLVGLYWAMGSDSSFIGKFLKKVMYVGVFALIISNFSGLADIVFRPRLRVSHPQICCGPALSPIQVFKPLIPYWRK